MGMKLEETSQSDYHICVGESVITACDSKNHTDPQTS